MKSVIITGATRGIGLALARFYADKGYCLMLNGGHNEEALAAVEKERQDNLERKLAIIEKVKAAAATPETEPIRIFFLFFSILLLLSVLQSSIFDHHHPVSTPCDLCIMCDHQHCHSFLIQF